MQLDLPHVCGAAMVLTPQQMITLRAHTRHQDYLTTISYTTTTGGALQCISIAQLVLPQVCGAAMALTSQQMITLRAHTLPGYLTTASYTTTTGGALLLWNI